MYKGVLKFIKRETLHEEFVINAGILKFYYLFSMMQKYVNMGGGNLKVCIYGYN